MRSREILPRALYMGLAPWALVLALLLAPGAPLPAQEGAGDDRARSAAARAPHADFRAGHTEHMVEMRDGVKLATSVYLPEGPGPWPVVVTRTPYGKDRMGPPSQARYTDSGYAYVVQDQRGTGRSQGEYRPHEPGMPDGYDTVEWVARQVWSNGRVGVTGTSAMGIAANLAAAADPPHLRAAFVRVAPRSLFYEGRFIGGMFKEADTGNWMRGQGESEEEIDAYRKRVLEDARWRETDLIFHRHRIDVPIYNAGGWYDLFSYGTVMNFQYLQSWGREGAKGNQKLIVGPMGHGELEGGLAYPDPGGGVSSLGADEELRFFDYWVKGIDNGIMDEPPVRYYMMAAAREGRASEKNGWRTAQQWPPTASTRTRWYLQPDGELAPERPDVEHASTSYEFDPADPVPTVGGLNLTLPIGPMDQREIGRRDDYLRFETPPLQGDVVVAGKIDFELCAATDGPDTDFIVKLVDVYPDGYEALVLDTGLRTRYRHGRRPEAVKTMKPGEPTRMTLDLWNSAVTFEEGHRIAVHVTSSNHPRFDVNPNTGDPPGEETMEPRVATNTIHHDATCPSYLVLPEMPE